MTSAAMAKANANTVQKYTEDALQDDEPVGPLDNLLVKVSSNLNDEKYNGSISTTRKQLMNCKVNAGAACILCMCVFGESNLLVCIHIKKILVALDLID